MEKVLTAKLVTFGKGGDSVYYGNGITSSGYGNPENPHAAAPDRGNIFPDGTPAIDTRQATDTEIGFKWVFSGPLVNVDLPEDKVDICPEPSDLFSAALQGEYKNLLSYHKALKDSQKKIGPLDSVCTKEFVRGWREHGARVGKYENGKIVWE